MSKIRLQDPWIHLWLAHLDRLPSDSRLADALSESEQTRAASYHFPRDRTRFLRRREFLRGVLTRYTDMAPDRLRFGQNAFGKPHLEGLDGEQPLSFSASHSAGLAAVCVARSPLLGIDIEQQAGGPLGRDEAPVVLAPSEIETLNGLSETAAQETFLRFWTCKEALVKAIGMGLSLPLDEIEIAEIDQTQPRLRHMPRQHGPPGQWQLRQIEPAAGYRGAIALQAESLDLQTWTWSTSDHILACG